MPEGSAKNILTDLVSFARLNWPDAASEYGHSLTVVEGKAKGKGKGEQQPKGEGKSEPYKGQGKNEPSKGTDKGKSKAMPERVYYGDPEWAGSWSYLWMWTTSRGWYWQWDP